MLINDITPYYPYLEKQFDNYIKEKSGFYLVNDYGINEFKLWSFFVIIFIIIIFTVYFKKDEDNK